ncbi:MAG: insulinase family protein [Ignavibacteria bacterium]|nr:insulinase family protein [Ignavibacteria bacterium]
MQYIDIQVHTLSNGLQVVLCRDTGAPVVTVNATYRVGSFNENRQKTGLAHLFEHLMFDNTTTGVPKQYDSLCTVAGGSNNAYTTYDHTTYYINLPSHQLELGLWLEAERMKAFAITEHALQTQRSVVVEEIKQNVENQPYGRWPSLLDEAAYTSECSYSWHVYGSSRHVESVTMDDATKFYNTYYKPSNAVLSVVGDIDFAEALERVQLLYGGIPNTSNTRHTSDKNSFEHSWKRVGSKMVFRDNVPVPAVFLAFHLPGLDSDVLLDADVASSIFGVGRSSALYQRMVKEEQIATHVGAYVDRRAHASLLTLIIYGSAPDVSTDRLVTSAVEAVASTRIDEVQFRKALNRQRMSLATELQRTSGIADNVGYYTLFLNDPNKVNTILNDYERRSIQSVQEIVSLCSNINKSVRVEIVPQDYK